tara:strand:+ start:40628 stop:41371 length:744 start_codon:yes stop_codon:yes gene_type:complete
VSRADKARIKQEPDIPFAQRTNPFRRLSSWRLKFLSFISIFLTIFAAIIFLDFIFLSDTQEKIISIESRNLLGHYPYPEAAEEDLISVYPGFKVHKEIYADLIQMRNDASKDGVKLVFLSGFRSIELQEKIFYENKALRNQIAIERARVSAPPGYSEHSTGYAVDIGDRYMRETDFEVEFENTPAFRWLIKNAARFHFVLSFPKNNPQNVSYEPWHWRYEGTVEALKEFEPANRLQIEKNYGNTDKN